MATKSRPVYFGETTCSAVFGSGARQGQPCNKKAYYKDAKGKVLCGTHSSASRTKLPKNPNADAERQERLEAHAQTVKDAQKANKKAGKRGSVACSKLRMMGKPEDMAGFLKVFPNFKHQNRKDGFGCASLSPMSLGPVQHGQKGLPVAKNLENYHQFNKVYSSEVGKDGSPSELFKKARLQAYKSSTAQRHKVVLKKGLPDKRVAYSVHSDSSGHDRHYDYIQSRYFYCHFYEKIARVQPDFVTLKDKLDNGYNLQLVGFDSFPIEKDIMHYYMETKHPFGHERALFAMLTIPDAKNYPWNKYYYRHSDLYPPSLAPETGDVSMETSDDDSDIVYVSEKDHDNVSKSDSDSESDTGNSDLKK